MTRIESLRRAREWSQPRMAAYLGVSQSVVSRIETGAQAESGPIARLLDQLEAEIAPAAPVMSALDRQGVALERQGEALKRQGAALSRQAALKRERESR